MSVVRLTVTTSWTWALDISRFSVWLLDHLLQSLSRWQSVRGVKGCYQRLEALVLHHREWLCILSDEFDQGVIDGLLSATRDHRSCWLWLLPHICRRFWPRCC